jgi:hypothetical protein
MLPDGKLVFLEVWDVPPTRFASAAVNMYMPTASVSYYVFDPWHEESIEAIKSIFTSNTKHTSMPRVIVILQYKHHHDVISEEGHVDVLKDMTAPARNHPPPKSHEAEILSWAKRQGEPWYLLRTDVDQDYYVLERQLMDLLNT